MNLKPGDHVWVLYAGKVREAVVVVYASELYSGFTPIQFVECPDGWEEPRAVPTTQLFETEEEALLDYLSELNERIADRLKLLHKVESYVLEVQTKMEQLMVDYLEKRNKPKETK